MMSHSISLTTKVVRACKQTCYIVTETFSRMFLTNHAPLSLSPGHKTPLSSPSSISCPNKTILSVEKHTHPSLCSHPWALPYCWSHYYFSIVLVYDGRGNSHPCFWRPQLLHVAPRWVCTGRDTWTTSQQQLRSQRGWGVRGSSEGERRSVRVKYFDNEEQPSSLVPARGVKIIWRRVQGTTSTSRRVRSNIQ